MSNTEIDDSADAQIAVEIDGDRHSEHTYFVEAMKVALLLRQTQPHSKIKVRDLHQLNSVESNSDRAT